MDIIQWCFAGHEYQFALLFENDVRGTMNQVVALTVRDRGSRAHGARHDNHTVRRE